MSATGGLSQPASGAICDILHYPTSTCSPQNRGTIPFVLHRPGVDDPSTLTESDARRVIRSNFPDSEMQNNVWSKLLKGENVFVHEGQLEWVSDATV